MTLTAAKVYDAALHYLQRYSSSTENLRRVLQRKIKRRQMRFNDVPPEAAQWVDHAVERCLKNNLVNDITYAQSRVQSLRRQGRSRHFILQALALKGVDKKTVLSFMQDEDGGEEEAELAAAKRFVAKKRLGQSPVYEDRQKDLAKILRAGFSMDVARRALASLARDET
jgi:regulatory protein